MAIVFYINCLVVISSVCNLYFFKVAGLFYLKLIFRVEDILLLCIMHSVYNAIYALSYFLYFKSIFNNLLKYQIKYEQV